MVLSVAALPYKTTTNLGTQIIINRYHKISAQANII
jgi:hypothetical protein